MTDTESTSPAAAPAAPVMTPGPAGPADPEAPAVPVVPALGAGGGLRLPSSGPAGRLVAWVARPEVMASIGRARLGSTPAFRPRLERARVVTEVAERALLPVEPWRAGNAAWVALGLYREAALWALMAPLELASPPQGGLAALLDEVRLPLRGQIGAGTFDAGEAALLGKTSFEAADDPPGKQLDDGMAARALVRALIERLEEPERAFFKARVGQIARAAAVLGLALALVVLSVKGVKAALRPPDLALDQPFQTSSNYDAFVAGAHEVDGRATKILFHTKEEQNPWFQVDLGAPKSVSSVYVRNRTDAFQTRAVPLVVELSLDEKQWTQVAETKIPFNEWTAKFAPQQARFVRVKSTKKTWLHLEQVSVRP